MNATKMKIEELDELSEEELKDVVIMLQEELRYEQIRRHRVEEKRINNLTALTAAFLVFLFLILSFK